MESQEDRNRRAEALRKAYEIPKEERGKLKKYPLTPGEAFHKEDMQDAENKLKAYKEAMPKSLPGVEGKVIITSTSEDKSGHKTLWLNYAEWMLHTRFHKLLEEGYTGEQAKKMIEAENAEQKHFSPTESIGITFLDVSENNIIGQNAKPFALVMGQPWQNDFPKNAVWFSKCKTYGTRTIGQPYCDDDTCEGCYQEKKVSEAWAKEEAKFWFPDLNEEE